MTATPWPCWKCSNPGELNLGTRGYCTQHVAELFITFSILRTSKYLDDPCPYCGTTSDVHLWPHPPAELERAA